MDLESKEGMREYVKTIADKQDWILNRDDQTLEDLINGLLDNKKSYGYQSCPCRLACGKRELDRDLICPCDYSFKDVPEYGTCYCNLYMRKDYYETVGKKYLSIPERRPKEKEQACEEYINEQND